MGSGSERRFLRLLGHLALLHPVFTLTPPFATSNSHPFSR
jgi:hypothetical protein